MAKARSKEVDLAFQLSGETNYRVFSERFRKKRTGELLKQLRMEQRLPTRQFTATCQRSVKTTNNTTLRDRFLSFLGL